MARTQRWIIRSLQRDLSDAALESNNSVLWSTLEQRTGDFLDSLFRQGAFAGAVPRDAYFVKCDSKTTTPGDIAAHEVNIVIGASFLRPAEFSVDTVSLGTLNTSQTTPSVPLLISQPLEGVIYLRFPIVPGFTHRFQSSGNLQSGSWFGGSDVIGDGSWVTLDYPVSSPRSFFRVETIQGW